MGSKKDAETHSSKSEQAEKEKRKNGRGDGGSQREFLERLIVVVIAGDAKKRGEGEGRRECETHLFSLD